MKLNQDQKDELKRLVESKWFKILEDLVDEMRLNLYSQLDEAPMWEKETQMQITLTQNQLKWARYLISQAKSHKNSIVKKEVG